MMKRILPDSLVLIPNYAIQEKEEGVALEISMDSFLDSVSKEFDKIIVGSFLSNGQDWAKVVVIRRQNVRAYILGRVSHSDNRLTKILNYCIAIPKILKVTHSAQFLYVFVPGHTPLLFLIFALVLRKRFAIYLRGDWISGTPPVFRFLKKHLFKRAAFALVTGDGLLAEVGKFNKRCEAVVPMMRVAKSDLYENRIYDKQGCLTILFVGDLMASKGVFELLDAFEQVAKQTPTVRLFVVGDGPEKGRLEDRVKSKLLSSRVTLHGFVEDVNHWKALFRSSDIFVLPTYNEGFPRVLYEAMSFALPIVTTNVGGIGGVMKEGYNCVFTKVADAEDLAQKLNDLISNEMLRQQIGRGGLLTMRAFFRRRTFQDHGCQFLNWFKNTVQF